MKNRGRAPEAFQERFGCVSGGRRGKKGVTFRVQFWEHFRAKVEIVHPKKDPKIVAENVLNIYAKRVVKLGQN